MLTPRATCTSARVCVGVCVCVCVVGLGCPTVCVSVRCGSSLEREVREKERQGPVTLSLSGEVHHGWRERQSERGRDWGGSGQTKYKERNYPTTPFTLSK